MTEHVTPLIARMIEREVKPELRRLITRLDVLAETGSTNDELLGLPNSELHGRIILAERQTAGKGRRGRKWQSPDGNLFLSIGWCFSAAAASLSVLGLVVGVCVCRALAGLGLSGHGIKWPNDILADGAKLGGILVELRSRKSACDAIVGIGINVRLDGKAAIDIEQPYTDLVSLCRPRAPDRSVLASAILEEVLSRFEAGTESFEKFLDENWPKWDLLHGEDVRVERADGVFEGRACGISAEGGLRLSVADTNASADSPQVRTFFSGDASVRRA